MRIGMVMPGGPSLDNGGLARGARGIEDAGFDGLWVFDAMNRGFVLPDPLTAVAVAATATRSVELGTGILQVSPRAPAELALRVMTAHLECGDRLSLGVGAGSTRQDFDACEASYDDRVERFGPALDTLRALLRGEKVNGVDLTPWPVTLGGPRVLVGAWANGGWIERAARELDGWIASAAKGGRLERGIARYREAGGRRAVVTNVHVDLDGPDHPAEPGEPFSLRCSPRQARDRLRWIEDLGYTDAVLRTTDHSERGLAAIRALH